MAIPTAATLSCWTVNHEFKIVRSYCRVIGKKPGRATEEPPLEVTELIYYPIIETGPTATPKPTQGPYPYPIGTATFEPISYPGPWETPTSELISSATPWDTATTEAIPYLSPWETATSEPGPYPRP